MKHTIKRFLAILLTFCLLASMLPTLTLAASTSDLIFGLNSDNRSYYVYDCNETASGKLTIPSTYNGKPVTSIRERAFSDCSSLTSITIPESVTSIGNYAFNSCSNLTSITVPDSVTSIGDFAFSYCSSLTSITIPDSVTSIGNYAFNSCSGLTSVTIGDGVTSIGRVTFSDCSSLTSITLPDSVTSIGDWAFSGCSSLTSITIGDSVTSIGNEAFFYCSSLTSVTIPESVTSIGDEAFYSCSSLTSITIGDSVTSIGSDAFSYCSSLTSITIPESVTSIGYDAFYNCSSLTSITIPESVTSRGDSAFSYCSSLTSVTIPDSVTSIGYYAFYDCSNLKDVYYTGTQEQWTQIEILDGNEALFNANIKFLNCAAIVLDASGNLAGEYETLAEAVDAAKSGETIVLKKDAQAEKLILWGGVTLDLNGRTLTVDSILTFKTANVVDSSADSKGLLKINDADGNMIRENNAQLPVYDKALGGYRFFAVTVNSHTITGKESATPKYWFTIDVGNFDQLYALYQAGADLRIQALLTWTQLGGDMVCATYATADMQFTSQWVEDYHNGNQLYISVAVENSAELDDFALTPCVSSGDFRQTGEEMK